MPASMAAIAARSKMRMIVKVQLPGGTTVLESTTSPSAETQRNTGAPKSASGNTAAETSGQVQGDRGAVSGTVHGGRDPVFRVRLIAEVHGRARGAVCLARQGRQKHAQGLPHCD